jgi:hypothetical protein
MRRRWGRAALDTNHCCEEERWGPTAGRERGGLGEESSVESGTNGGKFRLGGGGFGGLKGEKGERADRGGAGGKARSVA